MDISLQQYLFAFLLVFLAGLSTVVGGLLTINNKKDSKTFLSFALGLSAGVMIYVSFVEILPKSIEYLSASLGEDSGYNIAILGFFIGLFLIMIVDYLIPDEKNPHEHKENDDKNNLIRMSVFTLLAITVHNFPEGLATFMAALTDPTLGISIAVAIALHNIPEGIAVSSPIYEATKDKKKAMLYSLYSGIAEPIGAIVGFLLLRSIFNDTVFGIIFAIVSGIMVYISIDELLPTAEKHGKHHTVMSGFVIGLIIMALSLILI